MLAIVDTNEKEKFWGTLYLLWDANKKGLVRILVIFQHRPMLSHINGKLSPRPLE